MNDLLCRIKLAARLHDPAEKALVLLRDPAGHEGGTVRYLKDLANLNDEPPAWRDELGGHPLFENGWQQGIGKIVKRADWWAAAADRPQWPGQVSLHWTQAPALIHPLAGGQLRLQGLADTGIADVKERSFAHFDNLRQAVCPAGAPPDHRKLLLAFWRFGPEIADEEDFGKLGELWRLLPADTRVPDHSIWDHLDLVSALAGAFAADARGEAALLTFSLGPVQSFIAAARKTDDLWAGSHLLSRLAWEAMKPLVESLGPDAVVFPRLRGVALADVWLVHDCGLPASLFDQCAWRKEAPDANPLFGPALPNRFVALVPASRVKEIVEKCTSAVREWLLDLGLRTVDRLLEEAGVRQKSAARDESVPAFEQVRRQLQGFPEVHWAAVPFSLIRIGNPEKQTGLGVEHLQEAMAPFYGADGAEPAGFLRTPAWEVLSRDIEWEPGVMFYQPNPGVLYPAIYDLAERLLAAAKSLRPFGQVKEEGWRCTLTGETEWLTTDRNHLAVPRGHRKSKSDPGFDPDLHCATLWTCVAHRQPSWAKQGEHLGALPAIKRLWPVLFSEEVSRWTGEEADRYVVSTHTMALAHQLENLVGAAGPQKAAERIRRLDLPSERVSLPRSLLRLAGGNQELRDLLKRLPAYLDSARESEQEQAYSKAMRQVRELLAVDPKAPPQLETYYAMVLMDGDRMGAILSGDGPAAVPFLCCFHPEVGKDFRQKAGTSGLLYDYGNQLRPPSPGRHMSISSALSDFSQIIVPHVIEEEHLGRLLYSGGDDVMAMLPVADALPAIHRLRQAYRGEGDEESVRCIQSLRRNSELRLAHGYAYLDGRLMRVMGPRATVSCGVVIAHHMAPLGYVLRQLRDAEKAAKNYKRKRNGQPVDRDAFHIRIIKRSGGMLDLSAEWGRPLELLGRLRNFLASEGVSRRAVYNTLLWLRDVPEPDGPAGAEMLQSLLAYQLARQAEKSERKRDAQALAGEITALAMQQERQKLEWLRNYLQVAEFLARETRAGGDR